MFFKLFVPFSFMLFIIADLEEISTKNLNLDLTLQFKIIPETNETYKKTHNNYYTVYFYICFYFILLYFYILYIAITYYFYIILLEKFKHVLESLVSSFSVLDLEVTCPRALASKVVSSTPPLFTTFLLDV